METSGGSESSGGDDSDVRRSRRGHVLAELMQTEKVYVQELGSILSVSSLSVSSLSVSSLSVSSLSVSSLSVNSLSVSSLFVNMNKD